MTQTIDSFALINSLSSQLSKNASSMDTCQEHYNFKKQYLCLDPDCSSRKQVELFCSECLKEHYKSHTHDKHLLSTQENNIQVILGRVKTKVAMAITQFRSLYIQKVQNSNQNYSCKINTNKLNNPQSRNPLPKEVPFGQLNMILYNLINDVVQKIKKSYEQKHSKTQSGLKVLYEKNQTDLQQLFKGGNLEDLRDKISLAEKLQNQLQNFKIQLNNYTNQTQKESGNELSRLIYEKINQSLKELFMIQQGNLVNTTQSKPPQYLTPKLEKFQNSPPSAPKIIGQNDRKIQLNSKVISFENQPQQQVGDINVFGSSSSEKQLDNLKSVLKKHLQTIAEKDTQINDLSKQLSKEKVANKNLLNRLKQFKELDQKFMKVEVLGEQFQKEQKLIAKTIDKTKPQVMLNSPDKAKSNKQQIDSQNKPSFQGLNGNVMAQKNIFIRKAKQDTKNSNIEQKNDILSLSSIYDAPPESKNVSSRMYNRKGQK